MFMGSATGAAELEKKKMNMSAIFSHHAKAAKQYLQPVLFGQLADDVDFKFDGSIWTRQGDGAFRFNAAGERCGINHIRGDEEVMICA